MTAFSWYDLSGRIHHRTIQPGGCGGGAAATCSDPAGGEQVGRTRTFGAFGDGAVRCSSCWTGWGETARIVAPICSRAEGHRQNGHDDELRNRGHICIRRSTTRYRRVPARARPALRRARVRSRGDCTARISIRIPVDSRTRGPRRVGARARGRDHILHPVSEKTAPGVQSSEYMALSRQTPKRVARSQTLGSVGRRWRTWGTA
jgi:virulence-associated protein VagC